jgi:hypothetical protein
MSTKSQPFYCNCRFHLAPLSISLITSSLLPFRSYTNPCNSLDAQSSRWHGLLNLFQHFHGDYGKKPHLNPPAWVDVSSRLCHDHMTAAWARYHWLHALAGPYSNTFTPSRAASGLLTAVSLDYPISLALTAIERREHGSKS